MGKRTLPIGEVGAPSSISHFLSERSAHVCFTVKFTAN